ncbi:MAG: hypothetical protein V7L27_08705 [Nostoc sp.]|uniref:hypothetical protein n=1 Tax=Nostoc sp. TaxID=1180 RepID=UPI002FF59A11
MKCLVPSDGITISPLKQAIAPIQARKPQAGDRSTSFRVSSLETKEGDTCGGLFGVAHPNLPPVLRQY